METALARRSELTMNVDVDSLQRMGKMLAMSGYFEKSPNMDQAIAQMCTKIMAGRELGFGPFAAVNGIYIIQGRPSVSANLMASAVKASGRYDYKVHKMDATICEIEYFEVDASGKRTSLGMSTFTAKDADAAGTKNMKAFPRNMLFARAMSNGVRWYCPDVFSGNAVYVPEELGADVDQEGNVIDSHATVRVIKTEEVVSSSAQSNGGGEVSTTTDKRQQHTPAVASSVPAGTKWASKEDEEAATAFGAAWQAWRNPVEAQEWAQASGAYDNPHAARNGFKKVATELYPGQDSCKPAQLPALYEAYYEHVQAKLEIAKEKATANEDIDFGGVPAGTESDNPFDQ